jgi:outer membrane protein TolC
MKRPLHALLAVLTSLAVAVTGCAPTQPFFFFEDGDLSHYVGMATDIEHADVETASLAEVEFAGQPLTVSDPQYRELWELSLQDAVRYALENSKVMRSLGGRQASFGGQRPQQDESPEFVLRAPQQTPTIYDPAIVESDPNFGVEGALSAFDAQLASSLTWDKVDSPQNLNEAFAERFDPNNPGSRIFSRFQQQDRGQLNATLSKRLPTGGRVAVATNSIYTLSNQPTRELPADWGQNFEIQASHPLLQGAGLFFNRIAGPIDPFNGAGTPNFDGVVLARIRTDISLADFEAGVRNLVNDVEGAYWNLYFAYRNLEARKVGRDSAFVTWQKIEALRIAGSRGGEKDKEAQAREQYFFFRNEVETALSDLFRAENRLRYAMGLAATDGRLIAPVTEPTTARVEFDWRQIHSEAIIRNVELRQQRWRIKQRELELMAAKNLLLPRLDVVARHRWLGLGENLLDRDGRSYVGFEGDTLVGSDAFSSLLQGDFQESQVGLQFNMLLGFRRELATIRNQQLLVARERAVLQDQELELSHQLTEAIRVMDTSFVNMQTNFSRVVAAQDQVDAVQAAYEAGTATIDLVLDAQRRLADALSSAYRSQADYNRNIAQVHFRKGSLLEYNDVYLAEGPWPAKAYFDAHRRARARDAAYFLDYGFTRPDVISQSSIGGHTDGGVMHFDGEVGGEWHDGMMIPEDSQPTPAQPGIAPPGTMPEEVPGPAMMKRPTDRAITSTAEQKTGQQAVYEAPATSAAKPAATFDWKIDRAAAGNSVTPSDKSSARNDAKRETSVIRLTAGETPDDSWRDARAAAAVAKDASAGWKKAKK